MITPVNSLLSFFYFYLNILFLWHHEGFLEHTSFASISVVFHSPVIRSKDEIENEILGLGFFGFFAPWKRSISEKISRRQESRLLCLQSTSPSKWTDFYFHSCFFFFPLFFISLYYLTELSARFVVIVLKWHVSSENGTEVSRIFGFLLRK